MICRSLAVSLLLLIALRAVAAEKGSDQLQVVAQRVADQINDKPEIPAGMYSPAFLQAVPEQQLAALYKSLHEKYGPVLHVVPQKGNSPTNGKFSFAFKEVEMPVTLTIEPAAPHFVIGLWFGPPTPRLRSLDEVTARLAKLPGQVSYQIQCLDDGKVLQSHNADTALAIGSTFKLYVLATLLQQRVAWDKVVKIEARHKSLPSGEMQNWPDGSPVTVHTLALKMISISDNTAADHLLALAGREEVEKRLTGLGVKDPQRDVPFLGTRELFQLKTDADLRKKYLAADRAGREALLKEMAERPAPSLAELNWGGPIAIDQLEWFASAADLCRLIGWFDKRNDAAALAILAINPGLHPADGKFTYIGFKGGSESGVLNMTWLLHSSSGRHYALSASWNNPDKDVDLEKFSGLMLAIMDLLESPKADRPTAKP